MTEAPPDERPPTLLDRRTGSATCALPTTLTWPPTATTNASGSWPTVTPDGVAIMHEAGISSDTTPDALATAAGLCPVFRGERA